MANAVLTGGGINYGDILSSPYGPKGEIAPELALQQQSLNRRQQLAHLLLQQGGKVAPGQMVGRFYVGPDWKEGLTSLGSGIAGLGATIANQREEEGIAEEAQRTRQEDIEEALRNMNPVPAVPPSNLDPGTFGARAQTVSGPPMPREAVAQAMTEQGAAPTAPPVDPVLPGAKPPGFSGNYPVGEMPDESGWAPKGPIGDLNAEAPPPPTPPMQVAQSMVPPMQGPVSEGTIGRERTPEERQAALIRLMASRDPQAAAIGRFMAQQEAMQAEKTEQRAATKEQKQLDREARIQGQEIQLNQALMMGLITKEQKDQMMDLQRKQIEQTGELKRAELATRKELAGQGKTPPGYRATSEGNLEAIPGGPADLKSQALLEKDLQVLNSSTSDLDRLAQSANLLKNHAGLKGITGLRGAIPNIPGTAAADAEAQMNTLKSQIAFSVLQTMRNNSKTGGALGNVSDTEGKRLEANLAALDKAQSYEQMQQGLDRILSFVDESKGRFSDAYSRKHKGAEVPAATPPAEGMTPTVPQFHDPEKQKRYEDFKKKHTP